MTRGTDDTAQISLSSLVAYWQRKAEALERSNLELLQERSNLVFGYEQEMARGDRWYKQVFKLEDELIEIHRLLDTAKIPRAHTVAERLRFILQKETAR